MAITQTLLTTSKIAAESARLLSNNLVFGRNVNRDYDGEFGNAGAKVGDTINIRLPNRPRGRVGTVIDPTAVKEATIPLAFSQPIGVDYVFNSQEMYFSIDDFSNRFIRPAMVTIGNQIDLALMNVLMNNSYNTVGTPGTALTSTTASDMVLLAAARLYESGAPIDDGMMTEINSPQFNAVLSGGSSKLFNPQSEISDIYRKGLQGPFGGFDHYVSNNIGRHTNGVYGGTPLVNGAGQTGSTLVTDGWTATTTTLNVGDSFTIAGVYGVNVQSYVSNSYLQPFAVTAKTVTDSSGNSTISISPPINPGPGGNQTVSNSPADNAAITVLGASGVTFNQAVGFHKDAFVLASADLPIPPNVDGSVMRDEASGISVRYIRDYDVVADRWISRFDVLTAIAPLYPQLSVRIITA